MNRNNTIKGLIESCIDSRNVDIEKAVQMKQEILVGIFVL